MMNTTQRDHHTMLRAALDGYGRRFPDERSVIDRFMLLLHGWPSCLDRTHVPGHLTGSGWVVHPGTESVLLTHHRRLNRWLQLGGHADGEPDLCGVAMREVVEESGVEVVRPAYLPIFDIDIHRIPEHGDVPAHDHYDVRFAFVVDEKTEPVVSDESHDVAWVPLAELERYTREPSMLRMRTKWWDGTYTTVADSP